LKLEDGHVFVADVDAIGSDLNGDLYAVVDDERNPVGASEL
jgi:hypothetical protein